MPAQWIRPTGFAERGRRRRERPGAGDADRTAARPDLVRPVGLEVLARVAGLRRRSSAEVAEHRGAALGRVIRHERRASSPPMKPNTTPATPVRRRVVERRVDGAVRATARAVQARVAPERLVVDGGDLHQRSLRQALRELVAGGRQPRLVVDAAGERRRDRDDHPLRAHVEASDWTVRRRRPGRSASPASRSRTRSPSCSAIFSASSCVPPSKRHICAPSRVLKLRSKVPGVLLVAGGGDVEEREQERELARLGAEDRPGRDGDEAPELSFSLCWCVDPRLERLPVPLRGARRLPRRVDRNLGRELVRADDVRRIRRDRRVRRRRSRSGSVAVREAGPSCIRRCRRCRRSGTCRP